MIIIGADHAGLELKNKIKEYLLSLNKEIKDIGAFEEDKLDDFSKYVLMMRKSFNKDDKIIAVCGSGVGMSIGLNKTKGIFCVVGHSVEEVEKARQHNNINALALGGRVIDFNLAKNMVDVFLKTEAYDGKYQKRMNDVDLT